MTNYKKTARNIDHYYYDILYSENRMQKLIEISGQNPCSCESLLEWLFEDFVEETLENADGIVSGQPILVRYDNFSSWHRAIFVGYYNNMFYVVSESNDKDIRPFKYAKLPE